MLRSMLLAKRVSGIRCLTGSSSYWAEVRVIGAEVSNPVFNCSEIVVYVKCRIRRPRYVNIARLRGVELGLIMSFWDYTTFGSSFATSPDGSKRRYLLKPFEYETLPLKCVSLPSLVNLANVEPYGRQTAENAFSETNVYSRFTRRVYSTMTHFPFIVLAALTAQFSQQVLQRSRIRMF